MVLFFSLLVKPGVIYHVVQKRVGFRSGSDGKESTCNTGDVASILGLGRSPGGGHGYPFQYSCLGNPMERGPWWSTAKSRTQLKQ